VNGSLLEQLAHLVAARTGVQWDALPQERIVQVLKPFAHHKTPAQVLASVADPLSAASVALLEAVSVGETYFFRQPEQFEWIASQWLPSWRAARQGELKAWSAGTATGEEAYSLSATLRMHLPGHPASVLGTDLSSNALRAATAGVYRSWSVRASGPLLCPVVQPESGRFRVLPELREMTGFALHNLLDPPPGKFHLILCRNVLMYFSGEAARWACQHLLAALEPDGLLVLGVMDLSFVPPGLRQVGPAELGCFSRQGPRRALRPLPAPASRPAVRQASAATGETQGVARHLQALELIEQGKDRAAERVLFELRQALPDYLPAILESALLNGRSGRAERACELMRELLRRLQALPAEQAVQGPERLPVTFYRASATAFLSRHNAAEEVSP
jgi:chemotaxis protein methyltransferase CheR